MNFKERLQVLNQEHAKCKDQITAFEKQALRIEGAMALCSEIMAELVPQPAPQPVPPVIDPDQVG